MDTIANIKYTKGTQVRRYKQVSRGCWTNYQKALMPDEERLMWYAVAHKYAVSRNDAPRGGKWGEHFEILKYFTTNSLTKKMDADRAALEKILAVIPRAEMVDCFDTSSDVGAIKINGAYYTNFYGNGDNRVEVCSVDFDAFKKADKITRRQVYNVKEPISVVKFDAPKTINVSLSDVDDSADVKTIGNVCGFAIWSRKLKIFVAKNDNGQA